MTDIVTTAANRPVPTSEAEYSNGLDKHYLKPKFLKFYKDYKMNATKAAKAAKVSYRTYLLWRKTDEDFRNELEAIDNALFEEAQEEFMSLMKPLTPKGLAKITKFDIDLRKLRLDALKYFLDRKGRGKGWGAIVEEKDTSVTVNIIEADKQDGPVEPRKDDGV